MEYRKYDVKLQATISVYDALGELPLDSLSYANVLKPLIDLDYVSQSKGSCIVNVILLSFLVFFLVPF